jgi:uncharacterized protein (DUF697 family)
MGDMKNKLAVRKWHNIIKETRSEAEIALKIAVVGDTSAVEALRGLLGNGSETLFVRAEDNASLSTVDLVVILISGSGPIEDAARHISKVALKNGVEAIALIDRSGLNRSVSQAKFVEVEIALDLSPGQIKYYDSAMELEEMNDLLGTILDRLGEKSLALAARAPNFRPLVVREIINEIAGQNGLIGVASFIPAADMPVLTANQIRMVLKIAAAFGATVSLQRAKELLVVVGGGFTFRALARELIGLVPVAGWAVKGAVAYTGTRAVGELAARYFSALDEGQSDEVRR